MSSRTEAKNATDQAHDSIQEWIFDWKLKPGERINIDQLARELKISAIPIREALSRLHAKKLVQFEPFKGFRVTSILDEKDIAQLSETRLLIEVHSVQHIIRHEKTEIADPLQEITESMANEPVGETYQKLATFNALDRQFHTTIVEATNNSFLIEAYTGLHVHLHLARLYHVRGSVDKKEAIAEHKRIIESIRTRDLFRAEQAVYSHITQAQQRLLNRNEGPS